MLYPILIYGYLENNMNLEKDREANKSIRKEAFTYTVEIAIILILIALISCKFSYGILVIGSGSMSGSIEKGDVVFFHNKKEPLEVGDVIVFQKDDIRVVHRIVDIKNINDEFRYYTKGDANPTPDEKYVTDDLLAGKVLFRIRYIGKPTLWLRSLFSKEG
jgi:signal peptidase